MGKGKSKMQSGRANLNTTNTNNPHKKMNTREVDLLDHFVNDDDGRLCQTDPTILLIGHSLYAVVKQKPDKKSGVKSSVKATWGC